MLVGDFEHACVAPESYRIVPRDKNPDHEMWKEQILSGIGEDPDKPKIFMKQTVRNHSYQQFYLVLAKIRINRGLLCLCQATSSLVWLC